MACDSPVTPEKREQAYLDQLRLLLSYRSVDEMLSEALSLMVNSFWAVGGSLLYVSAGSSRVRQGDLTGPALHKIDRDEEKLEARLRRRAWQISLPARAPASRHVLPDGRGTILTLPLLNGDRIYGSVALVLASAHTLDYHAEQALVRLAGSVCAIAVNIERLATARQRLRQLRLFYQVGQAVISPVGVERMLQDTIELAVGMIDAEAALLKLYDPKTQELIQSVSHGGTVFARSRRIRDHKGVMGWVVKHAKPVLLDDVREDNRFDPHIDGCREHATRSLACVPLQIKGRVLGVLEVLNKRPPLAFDEEDEGVLVTVAAQMAIALDHARLYQGLSREKDRIIETQEKTRRELARNLHDGPVQLLAAVAMGLDYLERVVQVKPEAFHSELDHLRELTRQASQDARMLLFELRPMILETQGLVPALQSYVERLNANAKFTTIFESADLQIELDQGVASTIFSIVQEAVTNIEKHAQAAHVWIRLHENTEQLIVSVEDDGKGFDIEAVQTRYDQGDSFGLLNMQERAELINGTLKMESGTQRDKPGTLIQLRVRKPQMEESE
jgi:signal transduction histidine kinase